MRAQSTKGGSVLLVKRKKRLLSGVFDKTLKKPQK